MASTRLCWGTSPLLSLRPLIHQFNLPLPRCAYIPRNAIRLPRATFSGQSSIFFWRGGNCVMVHRYASWRGSCAWGSRESSTHGDYGQKTQARVPVLVPVRRPSRLGTGRSDDSACKYTHIPLTLSAERHSLYSYPPIHTMHLRAPSLFLFAQQGGTDRRSRPDVQGLAGPWMRTRPFSNESMANNTVGRYRRPGRALRPCVSPRLNALYVHRPAPCRS